MENILIIVDPPELNEESIKKIVVNAEDDNSCSSYVKASLKKEKKYKCQICQKSLGTAWGFKMHIKLHSSERLYKCTLCPRSYVREFDLNIHIQNNHFQGVKLREIKCCYCEMPFDNNSEYIHHRRIVHESKFISRDHDEITCLICDQILKTPYHLRRHVKFHEMYGTQKLPPSVSSNSIYKDISLDARTIIPPAEGSITFNSYTCYVCELVYTSKEALQKHLKNVHIDPEDKSLRKFCCEYCGKRFRLKLTLNNHLLIHKNVYKSFCNLCDYKTRWPRDLKNHILSVHCDSRPYKCTECSLTFKIPQGLRIHMRKHLGFKPFKCDSCDFSCSTRDSLIRHKERHECKVDLPKCKECDMCFTSISKYKKHMSFHSRPYKCIDCNIGYKSAKLYEAHKASHEDKYVYKCSKCNNSYRNSAILKQHKKKCNSGFNKLVCQNCSSEFRLKSTYKRHKLYCERKKKSRSKTSYEKVISLYTESETNDNFNFKETVLKDIPYRDTVTIKDEPYSGDEVTIVKDDPLNGGVETFCFRDTEMVNEKTCIVEEGFDETPILKVKENVKFVYICPFCERLFNDKSKCINHQMTHK